MKYNLEESTEIMNHIVMEDKAKREQKEKEDRKDGASPSIPSTPMIGSQEYIDNCDVPGSMDDGVALLLYVVVMVVGAIFNGRWLIWISATIVYLCHVFRRQIHKIKWEKENKNK